MTSQTAPSSAAARNEHARLDALRGLMAILVLFSHVSQILLWRLTGEQSLMVVVAKVAGRGAVIVFFLLSGYLITRSIRQNIARHGQFVVMDYVTARLARIYPPLIGAVLLCGLVWGIIHGLNLPGAVQYGLPGDLYAVRDRFSIIPEDLYSTLIMQAGLIGANGSLWTLYLEVHLYTAVLAIAAWRVKGLGPRLLCLVAGAAGAWAMRFAIPFAGFWLIGGAFELWPQTRKAGLAIGAGAALITLTLLIMHPALFGLQMDTSSGKLVELAPTLMVAALIFAAPPHWRTPNWLSRTGDFSYSLYVIHRPLLMLTLSLTQSWMQHSVWRALGVGAVSVPVIIALAMAFARLLERPKYFARLLRKSMSPPATYPMAQEQPSA